MAASTHDLKQQIQKGTGSVDNRQRHLRRSFDAKEEKAAGMVHQQIVFTGVCQCGACTVDCYSPPWLVVRCHCSKCRVRLHRDFFDDCIFWQFQVHATGPLEYEKTTAMFGLLGMYRSSCQVCKETPICNTGIHLAYGMAMVPAHILKSTKSDSSDVEGSLKPAANIHFASGLQLGDMGIPVTIHSDFGSHLYEVWKVFTRGLPTLIFGMFQYLVAWGNQFHVDEVQATKKKDD